MALDTATLRKRLKEAIGNDSQETVGRKLNMTQGNVSKLLSGTQQPTLETIYHVSEVYGVSTDWLLGISDTKEVRHSIEGMTYAIVINSIIEMVKHGALNQTDDRKNTTFELKDPLVEAMVKKGTTLRETDRELFENWRDTKLSQFRNSPLIWWNTWKDMSVDFLAGQATSESNWIEVLDQAKQVEDDYAKAD
jgi:transcriptional regulator with XRE-family HTH domain